MAHNFLSELTGSFAMPAAENPTVAMVEAAYRHHGLDWRYINCEVTPQNLGAAVAGARAMNWAGLQLLAAAQGRRHPASGRARATPRKSWAPSIASCAAARPISARTPTERVSWRRSTSWSTPRSFGRNVRRRRRGPRGQRRAGAGRREEAHRRQPRSRARPLRRRSAQRRHRGSMRNWSNGRKPIAFRKAPTSSSTPPRSASTPTSTPARPRPRIR